MLRTLRVSTCLAFGFVMPAVPGFASVIFQDTGTKTGWPNYPQKPQQKGRIDQVSSPTYKGPTALRFEQTYVRNSTSRFHSEVTYFHSQTRGQDRYYGFAMMLPTTWHNEKVKDVFQQWGSESPSGPWELMWMDLDHIKAGHSMIPVGTDFGAISKGVWHRIVTRIQATSPGAFTVWVDGTQRRSLSGTGSVASLRWSAGIYIAYWYDRYRSGLPSGSQTVRFLHQDQYRIATTRSEADPAGW